VELAPSHHYCASAFLAAKLVYKTIAYISSQHKKSGASE